VGALTPCNPMAWNRDIFTFYFTSLDESWYSLLSGKYIVDSYWPILHLLYIKLKNSLLLKKDRIWHKI
jgi:hypothetical protein